MRIHVPGGESTSRLPETGPSGNRLVSTTNLNQSVPDLGEQIKPIVEHVFAVAADPSTQKKDPTDRLNRRELEEGHQQMRKDHQAMVASQPQPPAPVSQPPAPLPSVYNNLPPRRSRAPLLAGVSVVVLALAALAWKVGPMFAGNNSGTSGAAGIGSPGNGSAGIAANHPAAAPGGVWDKYPPLPDPNLTPGEIDSSPAAKKISQGSARKVLDAYGIKPDSKYKFIARLVPVELGGSGRPKNLFPLTPWFANLKLRLDKSLVSEIKAGKLKREDALAGLKSSWIRMVHDRSVRNYGENDQKKAREIEKKNNW